MLPVEDIETQRLARHQGQAPGDKCCRNRIERQIVGMKSNCVFDLSVFNAFRAYFAGRLKIYLSCFLGRVFLLPGVIPARSKRCRVEHALALMPQFVEDADEFRCLCCGRYVVRVRL